MDETSKTINDSISQIDDLMKKFNENKDKNSQKQKIDEKILVEKKKESETNLQNQKQEEKKRAEKREVVNNSLKQKQKQTNKNQEKKSLFKKQQEQKRVYQSIREKQKERIKLRPQLNKFHSKKALKKIDTINDKKENIIKRANNAAAGSLKPKDLEAHQVVSDFRKATENFNPNQRKNGDFSISEIYNISRNIKELDKNLDNLLKNYEKETESSLNKLNRGLSDKLNEFQKAMQNRDFVDVNIRDEKKSSSILASTASLVDEKKEKLDSHKNDFQVSYEEKKSSLEEKMEKLQERNEEFKEKIKSLDDKTFDRNSSIDFEKTNVKKEAGKIADIRDGISDKNSDEYKEFSLKFIDAKIVEKNGYNPADLDAWGDWKKKQLAANDGNKNQKIEDIDGMVDKFKEKYSARANELIESKILKKDLSFTDDKAREILFKNLGADKNILVEKNIEAFEKLEKKTEKTSLEEKMKNLANPEKKEEFLQQKKQEEKQKESEKQVETQQVHQKIKH